jgi:hypothetical protein
MSITDKNLAAYLDADAFTVKVNFQSAHSSKEYRYVSNDASLKVGDIVVVPVQRNNSNANAFIAATWGVGSEMAIATVVVIDKELDIAADDLELRWIAAKVDLVPAAELLMRNALMTSLVAKAYRKNIRSSFAANILDRLDGDDAGSLKKLLGKG